MSTLPKNITPASDLELYEVIVAAYPDKFNENGDKDIWDDVMEFVEEEIGDTEAIMELIGRMAYLTNPMQSAITGKARHCIGPVTIADGKVHMMAAIKRDVDI
ncbi:hypothetical protein ABMA58_00250 [Oceanospirillum sp. HFRX-1_2]